MRVGLFCSIEAIDVSLVVLCVVEIHDFARDMRLEGLLWSESGQICESTVKVMKETIGHTTRSVCREAAALRLV